MVRGFSKRTYSAGRVILHAVEDSQNLYLPGGVYLDSSVGWHQGGTIALAGTPLVRHTTGLYRPWLGAIASGAGSSSTTLIVDDASLYAVGDPIYVGSTLTTVAAVDWTTNTITLTDAATWTDGSAIGPSNGYRAATNVSGFLSDEFGVDLKPDGTNLEDASGRMLIRGRLKSEMIFGVDALVASIAAGEQPFVNDIQIWTSSNQRLA